MEGVSGGWQTGESLGEAGGEREQQVNIVNTQLSKLCQQRTKYLTTHPASVLDLRFHGHVSQGDGIRTGTLLTPNE
jgi:hypothetical protein